MAAPAPSVADLQALIQTLQAQVAILQAAIPAAPAAGAAAVITFADTPQTLNANDLLDYLTKRGSSIYEQGCKALDDEALAGGFGMTTDQTVVFVEAVSHCATAMGWNKGTRQITTFAHRSGTPVDLIKCYGQINEATLKIACRRFCKAGEADAKSCAKQDNTMMAICLASSLTAEAQARLLTYRNEYTFNSVEYAPLLYKIIMRLATINFVATTQILCENLQTLEVFAATVNGDINKIHGKFDRNNLQLLACGATVEDPIGLLYDAYSVAPCHNFKEYIRHHHDDWLDEKLTGMTHKTLMTFATCKCDYLKTKGTWGAKSPGDETFVAMLAALNALKGHLKLNDKLRDIIKGKGKGKKRDKVSIGRQRTRRTLETRPSRRRTRHGRRCLPSLETRRARRWANTLTVGASIIWHGACTSRLNVTWEKSGRRNSIRQSQPTPQTLPPMPPLLLQWSTHTSRLSLPPLAQLCRGRTKKNDGASQHAYWHIC
jgi:hypothetical protein